LYDKLHQRDKIDLETYILAVFKNVNLSMRTDCQNVYAVKSLLTLYVLLCFCSFPFVFSETGYSWPFFCLL